MFVAATTEVYNGMIIGEHNRAEDLEVNIVREKHLTNIRSSTADELERLTPPSPPTLDEALEFVREDECVEVTPGFIRLRKVELDPHARVKASRARAREAREGVPVG
jgi:GTP-binding protein